MYEALLDEATSLGVEVEERVMQSRIRGLYGSNVIWINKCIETTTEKACVLAEEIGHHHKTVGDILDQSKLVNRKQERLARKWAWERMVTPSDLIGSYHAGCRSRFEIAEYLEITEFFLEDCLEFLRTKHGSFVEVDEHHILYLDPLGFLEKF